MTFEEAMARVNKLVPGSTPHRTFEKVQTAYLDLKQENGGKPPMPQEVRARYGGNHNGTITKYYPVVFALEELKPSFFSFGDTAAASVGALPATVQNMLDALPKAILDWHSSAIRNHAANAQELLQQREAHLKTQMKSQVEYTSGMEEMSDRVVDELEVAQAQNEELRGRLDAVSGELSTAKAALTEANSRIEVLAGHVEGLKAADADHRDAKARVYAELNEVKADRDALKRDFERRERTLEAKLADERDMVKTLLRERTRVE